MCDLTKLGGPSKAIPLQWWGFLRAGGELVLRPYGGMAEIEEAAGAFGVLHVRGPFIASSESTARRILEAKIIAAKCAAAKRRLERQSLSYSGEPYPAKSGS